MSHFSESVIISGNGLYFYTETSHGNELLL